LGKVGFLSRRKFEDEGDFQSAAPRGPDALQIVIKASIAVLDLEGKDSTLTAGR
jgi:hypothetical protein